MDITPTYRLNFSCQDNNFYIKREDAIPYSFGGNKTRKASLFFDDIRLNKNDCVVTYGSSSSNHCRVVANLAAAMNIPCYIISPNEASEPTSNSMMIALLGAVIIRCPVWEVKNVIEKKMDELKKDNNPFFIPGGGHGNIGTQAYVDAYNEIKVYERSSGVHFDYIFHASGTGTTQAGLVCGKILNKDNRQIIGISIARVNPYGSQVIFDSVTDYLEAKNIVFNPQKHITFIDDYIAGGYGKYNEGILKTIKKVLIEEGIPLDASYTGKAFWGMTKFVEKKGIYGKNILFIHTGGIPLFFDNLVLY